MVHIGKDPDDASRINIEGADGAQEAEGSSHPTQEVTEGGAAHRTDDAAQVLKHIGLNIGGSNERNKTNEAPNLPPLPAGVKKKLPNIRVGGRVPPSLRKKKTLPTPSQIQKDKSLLARARRLPKNIAAKLRGKRQLPPPPKIPTTAKSETAGTSKNEAPGTLPSVGFADKKPPPLSGVKKNQNPYRPLSDDARVKALTPGVPRKPDGPSHKALNKIKAAADRQTRSLDRAKGKTKNATQIAGAKSEATSLISMMKPMQKDEMPEGLRVIRDGLESCKESMTPHDYDAAKNLIYTMAIVEHYEGQDGVPGLISQLKKMDAKLGTNLADNLVTKAAKGLGFELSGAGSFSLDTITRMSHELRLSFALSNQAQNEGESQANLYLFTELSKGDGNFDVTKENVAGYYDAFVSPRATPTPDKAEDSADDVLLETVPTAWEEGSEVKDKPSAPIPKSSKGMEVSSLDKDSYAACMEETSSADIGKAHESRQAINDRLSESNKKEREYQKASEDLKNAETELESSKGKSNPSLEAKVKRLRTRVNTLKGQTLARRAEDGKFIQRTMKGGVPISEMKPTFQFMLKKLTSAKAKASKSEKAQITKAIKHIKLHGAVEFYLDPIAAAPWKNSTGRTMGQIIMTQCNNPMNTTYHPNQLDPYAQGGEALRFPLSEVPARLERSFELALTNDNLEGFIKAVSTPGACYDTYIDPLDSFVKKEERTLKKAEKAAAKEASPESSASDDSSPYEEIYSQMDSVTIDAADPGFGQLIGDFQTIYHETNPDVVKTEGAEAQEVEESKMRSQFGLELAKAKGRDLNEAELEQIRVAAEDYMIMGIDFE